MCESVPSPVAVLAAVRRLVPPETPIPTAAVAAAFDCPTPAVDDPLSALVEAGVVETEAVDGQRHVWWQPVGDRSDAVGWSDLSGDDASSLDMLWPPGTTVPIIQLLDETDIGVFVLDAEFTVLWANSPIGRYFGLDVEAVRGRDKRTLIEAQVKHTVEEPDTFVDTVFATYDDNTYLERFECHVTAGENRSERWLEHQSKPIESGPYAGGRIEIYYEITDRKQQERTLRHQHEQLVELNSINRVIREITDAVISQSTREEIETIVCDRLAATDIYTFAWIGEVDTHSQRITLRAEAGVEGYLAEVGISADPDDPSGRGPAGRAIRTGEIQVTQDAVDNPAFEPWQAYAEAFGYRSMAAVPIVYDETVYGVLCIYADRPRAFDGDVREVISQLGEIVGHAIAAAERTQALLSRKMTELQCLAPLQFDESSHDGTIRFDRAVPLGDGAFLQYGTVDEAAIDALEAFVDQYPQFDDLRIVETTGDAVRFELRLAEPPVVSAVASHGGNLQEMWIEDGTLRLTIHLPPAVAARRVIDAIRETYSTVKLVSRRQVSQPGSRIEHDAEPMTAGLTDRQQSVLMTAVHAGFFEWPRRASGEEVAASLDISSATFHQHLRAAQRKIFESLFLPT